MVNKASPLPLLLGHHHHHHPSQQQQQQQRMMGRTASLMLWLLFVSGLFLICITFSPIPNYKPTTIAVESHKKDEVYPRFVHSPPIKPILDHQQDRKDGTPKAAATEKAAACDFSIGKWVWEPNNIPMYTNWTCPTLPESRNCAKYGKVPDFLNWKWKPEQCELPRFDAKAFLRIVQGKRLAFVGDSVARNQMSSLVCLLSQVETPIQMHKDDNEEKFLTWYFKSHDFTILTLWTKFLIEAAERVINGTASGVYDLHLDRDDSEWTSKLQSINYIVISSGHWFFRKNYLYENGKQIGCVYCSEANLTDLGVQFGIKKAFSTALQHLSKSKEFNGLTLVRTFAPAHFEAGIWNNGGYCNRTRPFDNGEFKLGGTPWEIRTAQVEELVRVQGGGKKEAQQFGLLDITRAMLMRPDGHPGSHWNNEWMHGYNDCVHWCLPGAIDMWNDLLLVAMKNHRLLYREG